MGAIGRYRHFVALENPGTPVPDPEGGFTEGWAPLDPPAWHCSISPATARDLETLAAGTILSSATHVIKGRYHPGITTETRVLFEGRILAVIYVANKDERKIETDLVCAEVVA